MSENRADTIKNELYIICLEAFAGISAIMTHEARNVLAIINESAGFLEDLAMMAGEEGAVPVKNVSSMADNIAAQVSRANTLMKDYNTFAHSGDEVFGEVELHGVLGLIAILTRRKAAQKSIEVTVGKGEQQRLYTRPFVLESLIYFCLIRMYEGADSESTIDAGVGLEGERKVLYFSYTGDEAVSAEICSMDEVKILAAAIGADCELQGNGLSISLSHCKE